MSVFKQKDYLLDYIGGLKEIKTTNSFPIGTIIIKEQQRAEVLELLQDEKFLILEAEKDTDALLKEIFGLLENKDNFILDIKKSIPALLMLFLRGLAEGKIDIVLSDGSRKIIDNLGQGFFVAIVLNQDLYKEANLENICSSFCNLTR